MRRSFIDSTLLSTLEVGAELVLPKEASHHLLRVLRLRAGDEVEVFDGEGRVARGRVVADSPARLLVLETAAEARVLPPIVLAQAAVRGSKLDEVVRRSTELGASALWVFQAERSVVDGSFKKADRVLRIAREAARQSERSVVPALDGPLAFSELCTRVAAFPGVAAFGALGATAAYSETLSNDAAFPQSGTMFVVGPEGGLSEFEQSALQEAGAVPVRLGPHVQRTETAGLSGIAAALCALGWL